MTWIVATSVPDSMYRDYPVDYQRIVLVKLTPAYAEVWRMPTVTSRTGRIKRAPGIAELIDRGSYRVGKGGDSKFYAALADARAQAWSLNENLYGPGDPRVDLADVMTLANLSDIERRVLGISSPDVIALYRQTQYDALQRVKANQPTKLVGRLRVRNVT